jgi:putative ABC transport system substrate-binding protein
MKRRDFLTLFGAAATWPLAAKSQQKTIPVIGFLGIATAAVYAPWLAAFRRGLADTGYIEGQNLSIEYRWAEDRVDRLPALAAELVGRNVDVIATTGGTAGVLAAKAATLTIPIVFSGGSNLSRPFGNKR